MLIGSIQNYLRKTVKTSEIDKWLIKDKNTTGFDGGWGRFSYIHPPPRLLYFKAIVIGKNLIAKNLVILWLPPYDLYMVSSYLIGFRVWHNNQLHCSCLS